MPKIVALPPITEATAPDDLIAIHNASTGDTEKVELSELTGYPTLGWVAAGETWTYSSYDSTNKTGVLTVPTDATTKYNPGMRVRITQATGGIKFGIITKIAATAMTIYFGTDYALVNETVSSPMFSTEKAPFGFPLDPAKWTVTYTVSTPDRTTTSASYVSLTDAITVPIGVWELSMQVFIRLEAASTTGRQGEVCLSSDGSTETHPKLKVGVSLTLPAAATGRGGQSAFAKDYVNLASATTFTMLGRTTNAPTLGILHSVSNGCFRAVCTYL